MAHARESDCVFSTRLKALRELSGLSVETLAATLEVSPYTIQQWEAGTSRPLHSRLQHLADALGITYRELVEAPPRSDAKVPDRQTHLARARARRLLRAFEQCERLDQDVLIHIAERMANDFTATERALRMAMRATTDYCETANGRLDRVNTSG